jgi:hypothetical protein
MESAKNRWILRHISDYYYDRKYLMLDASYSLVYIIALIYGPGWLPNISTNCPVMSLGD